MSALTVLGHWIAVAAEHLPEVDLVLPEMVTTPSSTPSWPARSR
ncbi:hypothetical protein ABGB07_45230 [Micromonosporaceae bacterium B7E4]